MLRSCFRYAMAAMLVTILEVPAPAYTQPTRYPYPFPPAVVTKAVHNLSRIHVTSNLHAQFNTQNICWGSPIPTGWIVVNTSWNPAACGYNGGGIVDNIWTIEQYSSMPVGSVLGACSGVSIPDGWVLVGSAWNPSACGHPSTIVDNVMTIKRVS